MSTEESVRNETIYPDTVVNARLLGAQHVKISYKRIVGRCHSTLHPGKLTRRIMEEHNCLGKRCSHFEKYEEAGYWRELERKQKLKKVAKTQKAARKQQAAEEAEYFEELKVLFQSYADEAGYTMQITRVQGVRATIYVGLSLRGWEPISCIFEISTVLFPSSPNRTASCDESGRPLPDERRIRANQALRRPCSGRR